MLQAIAIRRNHQGPTVRKPVWAPASTRPVPPGALVLGSTTDFEELFEPLYPDISTHLWLIEGARFATPPSWEESCDDALDRPCGPELDEYLRYRAAGSDDRDPEALWVALPGFVPRYARYLDDDWCQLAGVAGWSGDPHDLLRLAASEQVALWRLPMVEVWFRNVDAACWQVASRRAGLIERVVEWLAPRADLRIEALQL